MIFNLFSITSNIINRAARVRPSPAAATLCHYSWNDCTLKMARWNKPHFEWGLWNELFCHVWRQRFVWLWICLVWGEQIWLFGKLVSSWCQNFFLKLRLNIRFAGVWTEEKYFNQGVRWWRSGGVWEYLCVACWNWFDLNISLDF